MASRRDLFQSYQFMVQRVISGIVQRETDPIQTPLRKMIGSAFAGVMIAVVGLAGAGLIGVFFGSDTKEWQNSNVVIVEKETGATFVWLPDNNTGMNLLFPTANFSSAALLVSSIEVAEVSRSSLRAAPRGPRLGIIDGADSMPDPERMLGAPWTLCSLPAETIDGRLTPNTAIVVGKDISQGNRIGHTAVLVRDIELDTRHFVWNGHQYPIPKQAEAAVLEGLILQTAPVVEVGTAWLNALPSGRELKPEPVEGRGAVSTVIADGIVGEIRYVVEGGNRQYYQVAAERIVEITAVQAAILLADPEIRGSVYAGAPPEGRELPSDEAARLNAAQRVDLPGIAPTDPPAVRPELAGISDQDPTICASFENEEFTPDISVEAAVAGAEDAIATQRRTAAGTVLADRVLVEPGHGTIVEERASGSATVGVRYLVTDEGRRYRISVDVQAMLGYGEDAIALPASLIARVPAGGALDPRAAQDTIG